MSGSHSSLETKDGLEETSLATVKRILHPESVAVIGASDDTAKWGGSMLALLRKFNYPGRIYPINPRASQIQGLPAIASIGAVNAPIDVALVAVPSSRAEQAIAECAAAGVKAALLVTAQFAESGEQGRALQERLVATAHAAGMRLIGPNCMGYFSTAANLSLLNSQALMRNDKLAEGRIALISQSGALAGAMLARAYDIGTGFSICVSLGNQADLEICDFFEYALQDPNSELIALYVEGLKSPERFVRLLARAQAAGKPVLITKGGRSDPGSQAVQSHTASLAGSHASFAAIVRHYGAHLVDDPLDLILQAAAWLVYPPVQAGSVGVFSGSGGGGAIAVDLLHEAGLPIASLQPATVEQLGTLMPVQAAHIPLDMGAVPATERAGRENWLGDVLRTMLADPGMGSGVFLMTTQPDMTGTAKTVVSLNAQGAKPLYFVNAASSCADTALQALRQGGLIAFDKLQDVVRHEQLRRADQHVHALPRDAGAPLPAAATAAIAALTKDFRSGWLDEAQTKALLQAAGVATTGGVLASSAAAAARAATSLGYPVVLKVAAQGITHKSDIGGVVLDLADEAAVQQAFDAIAQRVSSLPDVRFEGCLVQKMAPADSELIVGLRYDDQFGPMLLVGFGGTLVELMHDTVLLPASANVHVIANALRQLRLFPLLDGYRGREPVDIAGLAQCIQRIGALAMHLGPALAELDANPLRVQGASILVADARAVWRESGAVTNP